MFIKLDCGRAKEHARKESSHEKILDCGSNFDFAKLIMTNYWRSTFFLWHNIWGVAKLQSLEPFLTGGCAPVEYGCYGTHNADFIMESKVIYYLEQCGLGV